MAIDTTSESRRSTSACIASSAAGSVDRPRRTAGGVPAMCMSSARRGMPPPPPGDATMRAPLVDCDAARSMVRRPFRHRWPGIGRRKVDKSGYATVPGAATAGHRPHRTWRGGTTMTLIFSSWLVLVRLILGGAPGAAQGANRSVRGGCTPPRGWVAALLVGSHEHAVKPVSVAEVSPIDIADSLRRPGCCWSTD